MTSRPDKNKPRRPANWRTRRLVGSIVIFVVIEVLTGITLFVWPKVYEATASLQLEPVAKGEPQHETPEARVAALEKALYEWKGLEKFVAKWGECEEKAQSASSCLARTARIEPAGSLSYNITVRSSTSRHARDAANALAKQLAELTPSVFVTKSDDEQALVRAKAELSRAEQAIADFKAVHPGVIEGRRCGRQPLESRSRKTGVTRQDSEQQASESRRSLRRRHRNSTPRAAAQIRGASDQGPAGQRQRRNKAPAPGKGQAKGPSACR